MLHGYHQAQNTVLRDEKNPWVMEDSLQYINSLAFAKSDEYDLKGTWRHHAFKHALGQDRFLLSKRNPYCFR